MVIRWWKDHFHIPETDPRYQRATLDDLLWDYFQHRVDIDTQENITKQDVILLNPEHYKAWQHQQRKPNPFLEPKQSGPTHFRLVTRSRQETNNA